MWHLLIITQQWVRKDTRKYQTSSATLKVKLIEMLWYQCSFQQNLPRQTSTNSTASSTSDVLCRSNPDVPSYSSKTNILPWHLLGHAIMLVICFDLQFSRRTRPMTSFCIFIAYINTEGILFNVKITRWD